MPKRPSAECNSAGLNWVELQRGHIRRPHSTRGNQLGQAIVSALIGNFLFIVRRGRCLRTTRWPGCRRPQYAGYFAGSACRFLLAALSNEVYCWIRCRCTVTLATLNPGYLATRTESNSAALQCLLTAPRARTKARSIACSRVRPKPLREQEPAIQIKCQPACRIIVSKTAVVISFTSIHCWPKDSLRGSKRPGRIHPSRRKTEWSFTLAHSWIPWARW